MKLATAIVFCVSVFLNPISGWSRTPAGLVNAIACAPINPNVVAALVNETVWVSLDGGEFWRKNRIVDVSIISDDEQVLDADYEFTFATHTRPILAISDVGAVAVWINEVLLFASPASVLRPLVRFENVRGLLFDAFGRLWVLESNKLSVVKNGRITDTWPMVAAGALAFGGGASLMAVSAGDGVWTLDTALKHPHIKRFRSGLFESLAGVLDGWFVVKEGRLLKLDLLGIEVSLGSTPVRTKFMVAGEQKTIWISNQEGGWFNLRNNTWRKTEATCVCANALGKIWKGTSTGLVGPNETEFISHKQVGSLTMLNLLSRGGASRGPKLPRCRSMPFNPLPAIFFKAGIGRGRYGKFVQVDSLIGDGAKTWAYVGIKLVWSLDPVNASACFAVYERYRNQENVRVIRVRQLWSAWQMAVAKLKNATDAKVVVKAQIDVERLRELLVDASGIDPKKEKSR